MKSSLIEKSKVQFSLATLEDLPEIICLLVDDELGGDREILSDAIHPAYLTAFHEIAADKNNELIVGRFVSDADYKEFIPEKAGTVKNKSDLTKQPLQRPVIAVLQMTYIPNLTLKGTKRVLIEGVRVSSSLRGRGIGQYLFEYALSRAKDHGCALAELTTNKKRIQAHRFYERLGFQSSHLGFKLGLR